MSKRRRTSSVASRGQDEESGETDAAPEPARKKKKLDPAELCHQLYDTIRNHKKEDGTLLCDAFIRVPKRRQEPGYYEVVTNPIDLLKLQQKLKTDEYEDVDELTTDVQLMVNNAKAFYKRTSQEYRDACELWDLFVSTKNKLLEDQRPGEDAGQEHKGKIILKVGKLARRAAAAEARKQDSEAAEDTSESSTNPDEEANMYEDLFTAVMMATDQDNRPLHTVFQLLPSKKRYPEYYDVIDNPVDLKMIATKIQQNQYSNLGELEKDLLQMTRNACLFNEPGSQIYKDAKTLRKVISSKKIEVEHGKYQPGTGKSSERIRNKRMRGVQSLSAITAALRDEEEESDDGGPMDEDTALEDVDNPRWQLFETIKTTTNNQGHPLSEPFWKLPSKRYYPDYYKEIKNPVSLSQIRNKLKRGDYGTVSEVAGDMNIMFENAKKYNRPDSRLYKDALMLQRVALQTKLQLREDEEAVPDVTAAVQELLTSLFISIYNHQDEEGRCFSDSMAELPEHDEIDGSKIRALSLDLIKRRLDRGLYRRLDTFQEDIFACLERARRLSRTDSQVFEDSIELQSFFIRQRDELCRGGDLLHSPALSYTLLHLAAAVEATRQQKLLQEQPEEEAETRSSEDSLRDAGGNASSGDSVSFNQQVYRIGDFVYAEPKERGMDTSIVNIERLWTNQEGQQMMYGNYFYRPNETYHVTTRRFLEKEVFKSDVHVAIPLDQVLGLCCVLSVKDYFRSRPEGFTDKDVYVCESRYSTKARAFKKIKSWPSNMSQHLTLIPREEVLEPKRVMSVFRERVEKHKEEIAELEEREKLVEKEKPNVEVLNGQTPDGCTYYEQFNTPCGVVRTGDCVYVRTDIGRQLIAQVDTVWTNKQGMCFFRGPWLVTPPEIPHAPTRLFYKQEVFLSTLEDTNTVDSIVGKCAVLEHGEYISCRPTEIPEHDVYVCESVYDEARRQVKKLPREGLKKYSHSNAVTEDEIYFFRRLINPPKIGSDSAQSQPVESMKTSLHYDMAPSPLLPRMKPDMLQMEDSLDGGPPSVGSGDTAAPVAVTGSACVIFQAPSPLLPKMEPDMLQLEDSLDGGPPSVGSGDTAPPVAVTTPVSSKKKSSGKKLVTGYILYSSDVRRSVAANHPESSFGEISRIVGNEWRNLPAQEKQCWEERAAKVNEESAAKFAQEEAAAAALASASPTSATSMLIKPVMNLNNCSQDQVVENLVFECCWDNCDWQFEDLTDCIDHCIQEPNGHVHQHFANIPPQDCEFQCQWRGCGRIKKGAPPFPNAQRLARHVKEVHIQKGNGRSIAPSDRSKNFVASRRPPMPPARPLASAAIPQNHLQHVALGSTAGQNLSASHQAHSRQTPSPLAHVPGCGMTTSGVQSRPVEPLFISVPPRPQRLLHSEAYIKYIEGLQADSKHISHWDKHLKATPDNTAIPDPSRLPAHWLGNGVGNHGNIVNALWTLRDFMMRDALGINKVI
ncbi:protein polybromo-1 isoform X6 [Cryptotermes secundus]|uniref:protein polybromo-1 isoform X6 n=1 Tax=Cryptotermes secundus TaxID=105785 RepID=UPI001454C90F|nr:protein polybromo-1 isoform X6 [Cryptotermes secundus]